MLEQGVPLADQVNAPFLPKPARATADQWREKALTAYRRAYRLTLAEDLKREHMGPQADTAISLEAGEGIRRLLTGRPLTPAEKTELAAVERSLAALRNKPQVVTPVLFSLNGAASLEELLDPGRSVLFDLAGDGRPERWPWVRPETGILVWDPEQSGRIASGRQLFGSVTWWMFWEHGYEPLAALDDNGDGWLAGREMEGLAAWQDRNHNGASDPGEVRPLTTVGIGRVAVRGFRRSEGELYHPRGLQRRDGAFRRPTTGCPDRCPDRFQGTEGQM
jgi:hypothetical protein